MEWYIKDNIEVIEQRILAFNEEYAEEDKKPIYSREDIRRMRREMLQEFVDLPNKMVAHYEAQQEIEDQDLSDVKNIETL